MRVRIPLFFIYFRLAAPTAVMPKWLKDISGLETWPIEGALPFVPQSHYNLSSLPDVPLREQRSCNAISEQDCSFDCQHCTRDTDIISCDPISQTFDDGPTSVTPILLNALKKSRTKTTFFLIGKNVVEFPQIANRERKDGHLICVHTWSHRFLPALSNEEVFAELQWCIWAINATASVIPRYFRPPYGGVDDRIRAIAAQLGLHTVLWDKDTNDWQLSTGETNRIEILQNVNEWITADSDNDRPKRWFDFSHPKTTPGLILEHDLYAANVDLAEEIRARIKHKQKTVAQCCNGPKYQKNKR